MAHSHLEAEVRRPLHSTEPPSTRTPRQTSDHQRTMPWTLSNDKSGSTAPPAVGLDLHRTRCRPLSDRATSLKPCFGHALSPPSPPPKAWTPPSKPACRQDSRGRCSHARSFECKVCDAGAVKGCGVKTAAETAEPRALAHADLAGWVRGWCTRIGLKGFYKRRQRRNSRTHEHTTRMNSEDQRNSRTRLCCSDASLAATSINAHVRDPANVSVPRGCGRQGGIERDGWSWGATARKSPHGNRHAC
jgi:hypothetical protein